jgi:hypothetical protein
MSLLAAGLVNAFVSGRREAYDKEAKLLAAQDKVNQSASDERLKTKFDKAVKKYDRMEAENEISSQTGVTEAFSQWHLSGSKNAGISFENFSKQDRTNSKMHGLHKLGERPNLEYLDATDYRAPQRSFFKTLTYGNEENYTGGSMAQDESGKYGLSDVRTGSKDLTADQMTNLKKDRLTRVASSSELDVQKKQKYFLTNYQDAEMFPELVGAPKGMLKRISFDVANKTISLNREGIQVDIFQETLNSLRKHLELAKGNPTPEIPAPGEVDLTDTSVPSAERIAEKKASDKKQKDAEALETQLAKEERARVDKQAAEARAEKRRLVKEEEKIAQSTPSKVTTTDIGLAGNVLSNSTYSVGDEQFSFLDELSKDEKNSMETDLAGNVNVIINQTRMGQTQAYELATAIAKTGLTHKGHNVLTDVFSDEFSYKSPTLQWKDVYDTYNSLKQNNPNLTYDTVVQTITNMKNKK